MGSYSLAGLGAVTKKIRNQIFSSKKLFRKNIFKETNCISDWKNFLINFFQNEKYWLSKESLSQKRIRH